VGPKKKFVFYLHFFLFFWEMINILINHTRFTHLIKGIVLGRALWGVNTFPICNRFPDPILDS